MDYFTFSYCPYTDEKMEIPCENGYYSTGNASACDICPPGYKCPFQDQAVRYFLKHFCCNCNYSSHHSIFAVTITTAFNKTNNHFVIAFLFHL